MAPRHKQSRRGQFLTAAVSILRFTVSAQQQHDDVLSHRPSPIHAAFVAPPHTSHYVCMIPIAHALLDAGHTVTFIGYQRTLETIRQLYDGRSDARILTDEGRLHYRALTNGHRVEDEKAIADFFRRFQAVPYWV
eukprot:CAMPEP_0172507148 /NCGR_PEP_ID=MMETSP1066-20121228/201760_1 /TAXON_ID=671091 /ORGANISM="Coscinodiscus wailesii, Strain CCMP2513" /LENGTH=134 /DNA_ID=CAMNT_0013284577 /DNA_START=26 /DNA_END=427 /DNA_ORIENTATION=-